MRQTTLAQSGAPGCVIGWSEFSEQHTFVDSYYRFCRTNLLDTSFSLLLHFLPLLSLETSVCSILFWGIFFYGPVILLTMHDDIVNKSITQKTHIHFKITQTPVVILFVT